MPDPLQPRVRACVVVLYSQHLESIASCGSEFGAGGVGLRIAIMISRAESGPGSGRQEPPYPGQRPAGAAHHDDYSGRPGPEPPFRYY